MSGRWGDVVMGAVMVTAVMVSGCATQRAAGDDDHAAAIAAGGGGAPTVVGGEARPSLREYRTVAELADIHFDFDKYDIRPDAARTLEASAVWLRANPGAMVLIEGHADERGTNEYNMALGDRRARASANYLVAHGIAQSRITTISYGEERGLCFEHTEPCWARNRRAHFAVKVQ
jgi:peptidoglycan-associated lipoprotein